jgi:hypothetical protein
MKVFHLTDCAVLNANFSGLQVDSKHVGCNVKSFLENWDIAPTVGDEDGPDWEFCTTCVRRAFRFKALGLINYPDPEPQSCMII